MDATTSVSLLAPERVMACVDPQRSGRDVLSRSQQLASDLGAALYVVYVDPPNRRTRASEAIAPADLTPTETFGGGVVRIVATDVADGLSRFAAREGITHAVFGQSDASHDSDIIQSFSWRLPAVTILRVPVPPIGTARDSVLAWMDQMTAARLHAEHTRIFRGLLWRRVAILAVIWLLVGLTTRFLSRSATAVGLVLFAVVIGAAIVLDWRAQRALSWLETHREARQQRADQSTDSV